MHNSGIRSELIIVLHLGCYNSPMSKSSKHLFVLLLSLGIVAQALAIPPCEEMSYTVENQTLLLRPFALMHQVVTKSAAWLEPKLQKFDSKVTDQVVELKDLFVDIKQRNLEQEKYSLAKIDKLPVSRLRREALRLLVTTGLASDKFFAFYDAMKNAKQEFLHLRGHALQKGPMFTFHKEKHFDDFFIGLGTDLIRPTFRWLVPFVSKYAEKDFDENDPYPWQRQGTVYKHPHLAKALRVLHFIRESGLLVAYGLTGLHATAMLASDDGIVSNKDYLSSNLKPGQIQILVESTPFPHTALRIANKVYSYGYKRLQILPFEEYMRIQNMAEWLESGKTAGDFESENDDFLRRTIQVVTLNLDIKSVHELQYDLEKKQNLAYRKSECLHSSLHQTAFPYVNNCSVMALKNLAFTESAPILANIIPKRIYDSSPSTVVMYLTFLHIMGSNLVDNSFVVITGDDKEVGALVARNAFINFVDATLHAKLWVSSQSLRTALHSKHDDMHFEDKAYNALVAQAEESWARYLESSRGFSRMRSLIAQAEGLGSKAKRKALFNSTRQKRNLKKFLPVIRSARKVIDHMDKKNGSMDIYRYKHAQYVLEEAKLIQAKLEALGLTISF